MDSGTYTCTVPASHDFECFICIGVVGRVPIMERTPQNIVLSVWNISDTWRRTHSIAAVKTVRGHMQYLIELNHFRSLHRLQRSPSPSYSCEGRICWYPFCS